MALPLIFFPFSVLAALSGLLMPEDVYKRQGLGSAMSKLFLNFFISTRISGVFSRPKL